MLLPLRYAQHSACTRRPLRLHVLMPLRHELSTNAWLERSPGIDRMVQSPKGKTMSLAGGSAASLPPGVVSERGLRRALPATEDVWAILLGVGLVLVAVFAVLGGSSIKWLAVAPQKWNTLDEVGRQLGANATRYLALFAFWIGAFGISTRALGIQAARFLPSF